MKKITLVAVIISVLLPGKPLLAHQAMTEQYSQAQLLENWALSHCLSLVYQDKAVQDDARATASAYLEYGRQPMTVYHQIDKLAKAYSRLSYGGAVRSSFNTMKCIDFIHSKPLSDLITRSVK